MKNTTTTGYSLIELLSCIAIILVLAGVGLVCYQGAVDNQDLKLVAPEVAKRLTDFAEQAARENEIITVTFQLGTDTFTAKHQKGGAQISNDTYTVSEWGVSLLKRKLRFLKYEWPDGAAEPATFVFAGASKPQGGVLHFGSGYADRKLRIAGMTVIAEE